MRPAIAHIKEKFADRIGNGPDGISIFGAEIGVYQGDHAQEILDSLEPGLLYLIDPWAAYDTEGHYGNWVKKSRGQKAFEKWTQKDWDAVYQAVCERFKKQAEAAEVVIHRMLSDDMAVAIVHGMLDFIYIDGSHEYEQVLRDLRNAWALIAPGGVLCGHDFNVATQRDVVRAVTQFASEIAIYPNDSSNDFWFDKPEAE